MKMELRVPGRKKLIFQSSLLVLHFSCLTPIEILELQVPSRRPIIFRVNF